jgi:Transposase, Mutator family
MARVSARPRPERERVLVPVRQACLGCGGHMRLRYDNHRTLVTLSGPVRLRLRIRRCEAPDCPRFHVPYRPEAECALALPQHEFGLDVIALVGLLRHREHRSVPEIHAALRERGIDIAERSVTNLLDRYDELLATALTNRRRRRRRALLKGQGGVILALDGLQPDVGHEVLWVVRDCLSGEVLLARSLLSGTARDLVPLLREVAAAVGVPLLGVVSDGQTSVRRAVAEALPGVPHQLCQFHFLREAAHPVFEADRHAKVELKKQVRGVRPIERALEGREDAEADVARGYCAAVRSAITDDGRPPLAASGLKLKARLEAVADSLDRVAAKGAGRRRSRGCAG